MKHLTNKKLNQLTLLAATLPKLQRKNSDGTKMFRSLQKRILGKDLPASYKKKNDYLPEQYYTIKYEEPVLVDHQKELCDVFGKFGDRGVEDYCISLNKFYEANKNPIAKTKTGFISLLEKLKSHIKTWLSNSNQNQTI